jgi:hypothetical protein
MECNNYSDATIRPALNSLICNCASLLLLVLDLTLRRQILHYIEDDLSSTLPSQEYLERVKDAWNCDHFYDFLYGQMVGQYIGTAEGFVRIRFAREPTEDEINDIFEIVETYALRMKEYLKDIADM